MTSNYVIDSVTLGYVRYDEYTMGFLWVHYSMQLCWSYHLWADLKLYKDKKETEKRLLWIGLIRIYSNKLKWY